MYLPYTASKDDDVTSADVNIKIVKTVYRLTAGPRSRVI